MKFTSEARGENWIHARAEWRDEWKKEREKRRPTCMQDLHGGRSRDWTSPVDRRAVTENYRRARRWTCSAEIRRFSWSIDRVDRAGGHIKPLRADRPAGILDPALPRSRRWIRPTEESPSLFLSLFLCLSFLSPSRFFPVGGTGWVAGLSGLALRGSARETLQVA